MVHRASPYLVAAATLVLTAGLARARPDPATAPRVVKARAAQGEATRAMFTTRGVAYPPQRLFLRAFKDEAELELWAGDAGTGPLTRIHVFPICAPSGTLGPKRRRGDLQVPEGAYHLDRFNAWSSFHLSLGVSYPNASDRVLGRRGSLGGDIFIHGSCVTIGCIPIEDGPIERLFLATLDAQRAGLTRIPVHIFPARMDAAGMARLVERANGDAELAAFWENLRAVYAAFEKTRRVPRVTVDRAGRYRVRARE